MNPPTPAPGVLVAGRYQLEREHTDPAGVALFVARDIERDRVCEVFFPSDYGLAAGASLPAPPRIEHARVVALWDHGTHGDPPLSFLVYEPLGPSLAEQTQDAGGLLDRGCARAMLRQVAEGLSAALAAGVVHGQLAPSAVRGFAGPTELRVDVRVWFPPHAARGTLAISPCFASCELLVGEALVPATDVWGFALLAHFALSGGHYFAEGPMSEVLERVRGAPLPPASAAFRARGVPPPWPQEFDAWFARCLARRTSERFATVHEAFVALESALDSEPIHEGPWGGGGGGPVDFVQIAPPGNPKGSFYDDGLFHGGRRDALTRRRRPSRVGVIAGVVVTVGAGILWWVLR